MCEVQCTCYCFVLYLTKMSLARLSGRKKGWERKSPQRALRSLGGGSILAQTNVCAPYTAVPYLWTLKTSTLQVTTCWRGFLPRPEEWLLITSLDQTIPSSTGIWREWVLPRPRPEPECACACCCELHTSGLDVTATTSSHPSRSPRRSGHRGTRALTNRGAIPMRSGGTVAK